MKLRNFQKELINFFINENFNYEDVQNYLKYKKQIGKSIILNAFSLTN
jgi:hypothetical protein